MNDGGDKTDLSGWKKAVTASAIVAGGAGLYGGFKNTQTGDEIVHERRFALMQRDIADSKSHPITATVDKNGEPTLNYNAIRKAAQILLDGYNIVDPASGSSGYLRDQTRVALLLYFYDCAKKAKPEGSLGEHNALIEKIHDKYFDRMNTIALDCFNNAVMTVPDQERNSIARTR